MLCTVVSVPPFEPRDRLMSKKNLTGEDRRVAYGGMDEQTTTYLAAILQEQKYQSQLMQIQSEKLVSIEKNAQRCGVVANVILWLLVCSMVLGGLMNFLLR